MRGVAVPRGSHTVTMRYRPVSVYLGAALTLLGILGALALAWFSPRQSGVRASEEEIAHSLEGTWREELLFELKQVVEHYDFLGKQIIELDQRVQQRMAAMPSREVVAPSPQPAPQTTEKKGKGRGRPRKPNRRSRRRMPLRSTSDRS